jgi:membrane fusion protein, multidrug efflux system
MSHQIAPAGDHRKPRLWWFFAGTLALLLMLYRITGFSRAYEQSIGAVAAQRGDLKIYLNERGTLTPLKTVTVHTRVDGELVDVYFKEGQTVKAGDLLAEIDTRPYHVQLAEADAQMARDRVWLINAQAQLARYRRLFAQNVIAREDLDAQRSLAGQYAGVIQNDQALIDSARLNLSYCRITSPMDGRVGLRLADPGNIVHATDTQGLLVITQIQPVAVVFSIPEDELPRVTDAIKAVPQLPIDAYDRGFKNHLASGTLLTLDNEIDQNTRTVKLKATFPNEDNALLPHQSVNTRLLVDTMHDAVLIPAAGVQRSPQGIFVYVVTPDRTVATRSVVVGATQGDTAAIDWGLNPGELVVVHGTDKLRRGNSGRVQLAANPVTP